MTLSFKLFSNFLLPLRMTLLLTMSFPGNITMMLTNAKMMTVMPELSRIFKTSML